MARFLLLIDGTLVDKDFTRGCALGHVLLPECDFFATLECNVFDTTIEVSSGKHSSAIEVCKEKNKIWNHDLI